MSSAVAEKNSKLKFVSRRERKILPNEEAFSAVMGKLELEDWPWAPIATMKPAQLREKYVLDVPRAIGVMSSITDLLLFSSIPSFLKW
jgi:hypothetical protein